MEIELPWPPSTNQYWRRSGCRMHISPQARKYIDLVCALSFSIKKTTLKNRVSLNIQAFPPDKRIRDLDNLLKVFIDALVKANFLLNDGQIDCIHIERKNVVPSGKMIVSIKEWK